MADLLTTLQSLMTQAQTMNLSLPARLRAVGMAAQMLDRLFIWPTLNPPGDLPTASTDGATSIATYASHVLQEAAQVTRSQLLPNLSRYHIHLAPVEQLGEQQQAWLFAYFRQAVYPLLTPLAVDSGRPFPYISSDSLNLLVLLQRPGAQQGQLYARVKIPRIVPRLISVPPLAKVDSPVLYQDGDCTYWVWSEDVVRYYVHELFAGMSVTGIYQFRVLRAAEHEHERSEAEGRSRREKFAPAVRLDAQNTMPVSVLQWLTVRLGVSSHAVFACDTPLRMVNLLDLADQVEAHPIG
jgi:polyphosphate kinase